MSKGQRIEIMLDGALAAWMAGCVGSALVLAAPGLGIANMLPIALASAVAAALITYRGLSALRRPLHRLPAFDLVPVEAVELEPSQEQEPPKELLLTPAMAVLTSELLLTRGQMLNPPSEEPIDALLLDDVLAELQPESRVVQLFDPTRFPTAGELQSRIDRHLSEAGRVAPDGQQPDASQALYDALADLRRSLG